MVLTRTQAAVKHKAAERHLVEERRATRAETSGKKSDNTKSDADLQPNAKGDVCLQEHAGHSGKESKTEQLDDVQLIAEARLGDVREMSVKDVASGPGRRTGDIYEKKDDCRNAEAGGIVIQTDSIQEADRTGTGNKPNVTDANPTLTGSPQLSEAEDDGEDDATNAVSTPTLEIKDVSQKLVPLESRKRKRSSSRKNDSAVVYMSRVPPGMDVGALRALLSRTGTLGRVWLRPEDPSAVSARRKLGGRRRSGFSDGWVEYTRRRDARNAVELLNGRPMAGAKRGGRWKNDLWCLKLLQKGFSWDDLVEETCGSKRERILKVKAAVAASRREKAFVEERAELAKRIAMKEGRLEAEDVDEEGKPVKELEKRIVRRFRQRGTFEEMDYEDDVDERRAREAARRLEEGDMEGAQKKTKVDAELVQMLFGKKGSQSANARASD